MIKKAFTLAEVLITLGIIGVVAAMTLPTLIQKKTNIEIETKLKKIYSVMNQAILMSEIDNGPKEYWPQSCNASTCESYYKTYILSYLKTSSIEKFASYGGENFIIYFTDGTALVGKLGYDYFFFPNAKNFDRDTFASMDESGGITGRKDSGKTYFVFRLTPASDTEINKFHYKKGFEPYKYGLDNLERNNLLYNCKNSSTKASCTALIQQNNWKIPDNYPHNVK